MPNDDLCQICRKEPAYVSYTTCGTTLAVGERCWEAHCDKRINLMEYCAPKCDDFNDDNEER